MEDEPLEFELHGYVDGALDEESMARVEQYLLENPAAAAKVRDYLEEKRHIRDYATEQASLKPSAAIQKLERELARRLRRPRFFRWPHAAVIGLAFATAGWLTLTTYPSFSSGPEFTDEILGAHALTSAYPSEVGPLSEERLTRLFSRIGEPARLPDLGGFGFEAVGAQLLASDEGPVLHILYRGNEGQTMSYFIYHDSKPDEVPFHMLHPKGLTMMYWQHDYSRYAVAGPLPDAQMETIARHLDSSLARKG